MEKGNIDPQIIAQGLGSCDREVLSSLLSLYEDTEVIGMSYAALKDMTSKGANKIHEWLSPDDKSSDKATKCSSIQDRINKGAKKIYESEDSDDNLRLRLFLHLWDSLGMDPDIPASENALKNALMKYGEKYSKEAAQFLWNEQAKEQRLLSGDYWKKFGKYKINPFAKKKPEVMTFEDAFKAIFLKIISGVAKDGDAEIKDNLGDLAMDYIEKLDAEKRGNLLEAANAEKLTRETALKILVLQGGLIGTGIAAELAGFAAYILAAELSAIIPFVGGQTMVCMLAVISNPLFIIPGVVLLGTGFGKHATNKLRQHMALNIVPMLVLQGVAAEEDMSGKVVDIFYDMPELLPDDIIKAYRESTMADKPLDRAWDNVKSAGGWCWNVAKTPFQISKYPNMFDYLKKWELFTGRSV